MDSLIRRKLEHRFGLLDVDDNGQIEQADFELLITKTSEAFNLQPDAPAAQAVGDAYRQQWAKLVEAANPADGERITRDEFVAGFAALTADQTAFDEFVRPTAEALVAAADADGSGWLSLAEFRRLAEITGVAESDVERFFHLVDGNGDGRIQCDELLSAVRDFYLSDDPQAPGNQLFGQV